MPKKTPSTVGGQSLCPCAGSWQQREEIRKPHQAVTSKAPSSPKTIQPPVAGSAALSSPSPVSLTTPNNGGEAGQQNTSPAQKNLPLFAVARRHRSSARGNPQGGKVQNRNARMGKGVLHTVYSLQKKKKGSVDRVCCCCESVGRGWRGGLEERTNERTLWSCGAWWWGGGHSGTLVWV